MYLVAGHLETAYSETRKNDSYRQNVLGVFLKSDLRVFFDIFILHFYQNGTKKKLIQST